MTADWTLHLGPAPGGEVRPLLPPGGEYARAVALVRGVPAEVTLHLYGYEFLERLHEHAGHGGDATLPFWPGSLFAALGPCAHAAREIERALPPLPRVCWRPWAPAEWDAAVTGIAPLARLGGALDAERYAEDLAAVAARCGWARR